MVPKILQNCFFLKRKSWHTNKKYLILITEVSRSGLEKIYVNYENMYFK